MIWCVWLIELFDVCDFGFGVCFVLFDLVYLFLDREARSVMLKDEVVRLEVFIDYT